LRYHPQAYVFVTEALRQAQELVGKDAAEDEESAHISGRELLEGVRVLGLKQFGMMAPSVFDAWGIPATGDFINARLLGNPNTPVIGDVVQNQFLGRND
jgi:uncharacterized repeat protein (TIGR04138 family)